MKTKLPTDNWLVWEIEEDGFVFEDFNKSRLPVTESLVVSEEWVGFGSQ